MRPSEQQSTATLLALREHVITNAVTAVGAGRSICDKRLSNH